MAQEQVEKPKEEEQKQEQKPEQKKEKKTVETKLHNKDAWLDSVIEEVKPILEGIEKNTFDQYRKVGLIVMSNGYQKGQWHSYHKERFMKNLKVDRSTFSLFVRLGEMTPDQFNETKNTFSSIKQWYRGGKPKSISEERQKLIQGLINRWPGMAKEIKEILRTQNPYITEKELAELNNVIIKTNKDPVQAFVENFYLQEDSSLKIPVSLVIGFKEYMERKNLPEGTLPEAVIIKILQEKLKEAGITKDVVAQRAKLELKMQWGR